MSGLALVTVQAAMVPVVPNELVLRGQAWKGLKVAVVELIAWSPPGYATVVGWAAC